jgi:hypothetical protein
MEGGNKFKLLNFTVISTFHLVDSSPSYKLLMAK